MPKILYEDNQIIVCVKPYGILSTSGEGAEESVETRLSSHREQNGERGEIFTVHRLDRGVGGVMVYAKNAKAAAELSKISGTEGFRKEYLAVVRGLPEEKCGTYRDLLFKDSRKNKSFVVDRMRRGVKEASLEYEVLQTAEQGGESFSLVKIKLHTGRTHQIRVQFASRKTPLVGDGKYGGSDNRAENIALFSRALTIRHPKSDKELCFSAEMPEGYPWELFGGI